MDYLNSYNINLEELLLEKFFKLVDISFGKQVYRGYLVGIQMPVSEMLILYYIKEIHVEKYIKHQNTRWIEKLPFMFIKDISLIPDSDKEKEYLLEDIFTDKDITMI